MASLAAANDSYEVYFEAQDAESSLCGQHALNNLLQGAYFSAVDLGNIGAKLDEEEEKLLSGPSTCSQATNPSPKYSNVSLDGNFSILVLITALKQLGVDALPLSHPDCSAANVGIPSLSLSLNMPCGLILALCACRRGDCEQEQPTKEEGFIFYQMAHWIAYRRIHGVWYDLNSQSCFLMVAPQPVAVSDFFLSAQLSKLQDEV